MAHSLNNLTQDMLTDEPAEGHSRQRIGPSRASLLCDHPTRLRQHGNAAVTLRIHQDRVSRVLVMQSPTDCPHRPFPRNNIRSSTQHVSFSAESARSTEFPEAVCSTATPTRTAHTQTVGVSRTLTQFSEQQHAKPSKGTFADSTTH